MANPRNMALVGSPIPCRFQIAQFKAGDFFFADVENVLNYRIGQEFNLFVLAARST